MKMKMNKDLQKKLNPLFFKVEKVPLKNFLAPYNDVAGEADESVTVDQQINHCIVAHTDQGQKIVNFCSKNYELITNKELLTPLIEGIADKHDIEIKKASHSGHAKFFIDVLLKDKVIKLKKDDIFPRLSITNSYDGSIKYQFAMGFYRLVCSNGMSVPVKGSEQKFKLTHTPYAGDGAALNQSLSAVDKFMLNTESLMEGYKTLMENKLTLAQAEERMKEAAKETDYPSTNIPAAMDRLQTEQKLGYKIDDYLVYNAMNFAMFNNTEAKILEHKKAKADAQVINYLLTNK